MRAKIISDGTRAGTKVVDPATGAVLKMVQYAEWEHAGGEFPTITLRVVMPAVELEADARLVGVCPHCGAERELEELPEEPSEEEGDGGSL